MDQELEVVYLSTEEWNKEREEESKEKRSFEITTGSEEWWNV